MCYIDDHYREVFYWMEDEEIINPLNEVHLLALQIVFIPRVNKSLSEFILHWNNHAMRTEHSQTPAQLWVQGVYANIDGDTVRDLAEPESTDAEECGVGVDEFAGIQTNNDVVIPRRPFGFTDNEQDVIKRIDPFQQDESYGVDTYMQTVAILKNMGTVQSYYAL